MIRSRSDLLFVLALAVLPPGVSTAQATSETLPRHKPVQVPPGKMPPLAPAVIDDALLIGGEDLYGREVDTRMTVGVRVNGRGPFPFVVDSGADSSVIGSRVASALHLPTGTSVILNGMTASDRVDRVRVDDLALGQSTFRDLELPVLEERDVGAMGMIGIDALVQQRLMMDFEKRVIKVEDARTPAPRLDGEIVVTARRRRGQLILTQAAINGKPVDAVVDTGSEITIGNLALRDQLFRHHRQQVTTIPVTGVTGVTINLQLARVAELRLGPVLLRNVPIAFADVPPFAVFGLSSQPALLLGTDLLATFRRISLDFRARKVRFQLRRCHESGIIISTTSDGSSSRLSVANGGDVACRR